MGLAEADSLASWRQRHSHSRSRMRCVTKNARMQSAVSALPAALSGAMDAALSYISAGLAAGGGGGGGGGPAPAAAAADGFFQAVSWPLPTLPTEPVVQVGWGLGVGVGKGEPPTATGLEESQQLCLGPSVVLVRGGWRGRSGDAPICLALPLVCTLGP